MSRVEPELQLSKLPSCLLPVEVEPNDKPAGACSPRRRFWPPDAAARAGQDGCWPCCLGCFRPPSAEGSAAAAPSSGGSTMVWSPPCRPPAGRPSLAETLSRVWNWGFGSSVQNRCLAASLARRILVWISSVAVSLALHGPRPIKLNKLCPCGNVFSSPDTSPHTRRAAAKPGQVPGRQGRCVRPCPQRARQAGAHTPTAQPSA